MRLVIAAVGKLKTSPERELFRSYVTRIDALSRSVRVGPVMPVEIMESRLGNPTGRRTAEGESLFGKIEPGLATLALDTAGDLISSEDLAANVLAARDDARAGIACLIGGPDGHAPETLARCEKTFSLGRITLPHGLARIVLAEQLYRALTIIAHHPYHRA